MHEEADIEDTPIRISKKPRKKKKPLYFCSKKELERSRMTRKTQALTSVKDITLIDIAKTLDFGDGYREEQPSAMNAGMCARLNVENEERIVKISEMVIVYLCIDIVFILAITLEGYVIIKSHVVFTLATS